MEQRFIESGKDFAKYISQKYHIKKTAALVERCIKFRYDMFCADQSPDYAVALEEQEPIRVAMIEDLINEFGITSDIRIIDRI